MGATGQPDSSGRRGRGGPRPWWEDYRTTVLTVLVAVAGLCTTAMGVVGREAQIVLLVVSVALVLLGLAALVRVPTYARWFAAAGRWAVRRWTVVLPVVLVVTTGAGLGLLWLQRERSCDDAAEIAVVVPEDGAADFSAVADAFERDSVNTFSCPSYHVTTFGMGWPALRAALVSGWDEGSSEEPGASLALGPRPDVWIAESTAQAALVTQEAGSAVTAAEPVPVAGSPLVLAVPAPYAQGLRATTTSDDPVRVLVDAAEAVGLDVVRANPDTSFAAALHSVSLYDGTVADAEALELSLGHALERAGLPFGSDGALLCRLAELSAATAEPPRVAVLTTERAAVTGGADCPAAPGTGTGAELVPFYPEGGPGLEYAAVRLDWAPAPGGRGEQGAEAFVRWLTTPRGQAVLESRARVRDLNGQPLSGLDGLLAGEPVVAVPSSGRVGDTRVRGAENLYRAARRPVRVLVLVDSSASMGRPADGERNRMDVARRGVLTALGHLGGADEVGIWSFSGAAGDSPRPLLDLTRSTQARQAAPEALRPVLPGGVTPLYDALDAGTSYLAGLDPGGASRQHLTALVVLTDGEDHPGGPAGAASAAGLVRAAQEPSAAGVRVYAVAVGEASCQVSELQEVTTAWGGECWDSGFGELEDTLDGLFAQLGGR